MRIEVLCTGDELLTGVIADTNSPFLMARLVRLGERVARVTVVGDDRAAIRDALREIAARADVVVVSGGLGPTSDDLTVDAAAEAAGVGVVEDTQTLRRIRARFERIGVRMTENNRRQARVPEGSEVLPNDVGSSPMFVLRIGACVALFLPGVPREYEHLVQRHVLPRIEALRAERGIRTFQAFRILRTVGLPESHMDQRIAPLAAKHPAVTFGFRTVPPENHLELLAVSSTSQEHADARLAAAEHDARTALGDFVFGADDQSLPDVVVDLLRRRREAVSCAESCTGGLVAKLLTDVPGASDVLPGAVVTYDEAFKTEWADVPAELIARAGVVSREVAEALARGIRHRARTTWGLGVTGYAGPGGGDEKEPVGAVHVAVAGPDPARPGSVKTTWARQVFSGDRARVRMFAAYTVLDQLRRRLVDEERNG